MIARSSYPSIRTRPCSGAKPSSPMRCRDKVKQNDPDCKIVILVDDQADSELAQKVKDAKREGKIDAFLFGSVTEQYMAAVLDSL